LASFNFFNFIDGPLPIAVTCGLVRYADYIGNNKKEPYRFNPRDLRNVSLYKNNDLVDLGYNIELPTTNCKVAHVAQTYHGLYYNSLKGDCEGPGIDKKEFLTANFLLRFNLTADKRAIFPLIYNDPKSYGTLSLTLEFNKPITTAYAVIVLLEYSNNVEIDYARNIIIDF
jgi:hypothetical protein